MLVHPARQLEFSPLSVPLHAGPWQAEGHAPNKKTHMYQSTPRLSGVSFCAWAAGSRFACFGFAGKKPSPMKSCSHAPSSPKHIQANGLISQGHMTTLGSRLPASSNPAQHGCRKPKSAPKLFCQLRHEPSFSTQFKRGKDREGFLTTLRDVIEAATGGACY